MFFPLYVWIFSSGITYIGKLTWVMFHHNVSCAHQINIVFGRSADREVVRVSLRPFFSVCIKLVNLVGTTSFLLHFNKIMSPANDFHKIIRFEFHWEKDFRCILLINSLFGKKVLSQKLIVNGFYEAWVFFEL